MKFRLSVCALVLFSTTGCDNWLMNLRQQMYRQPKYMPQAENNFFPDHRDNRPLELGVVPHGVKDEALTKGVVDGQPISAFPFQITRKDIERGMHRYNVFCSPCHSRLGDGWGMVVRRGFKKPPSFMEARLKAAPITHFFNVMTNGIGMMSGYSAQIPPADRWRIVAYIKALQLSQDGRVSDVPESERAQLEAAK